MNNCETDISGDCPAKPTCVTRPKRWNEAIRLADLRAQSPSLTITLWRTIRANDAKATAFQGRCERVASFEHLTLTTPDASRDSRRYRKMKHTATEERCLPYRLADLRAQSPSLAITLWRTIQANDVKATAFRGRCERVASFEPLTFNHTRCFAGQSPLPKRDARRRRTKPYFDAYGGPRNR
jgi:hypothetical protein